MIGGFNEIFYYLQHRSLHPFYERGLVSSAPIYESSLWVYECHVNTGKAEYIQI